MAGKLIVKALDQQSVKTQGEDESESYLELTPEEGQELAGGLDGACPSNNNSCPPPPNTGCR